MALQVNKGIIACGDDEYLMKIHANVPVVYYGFAEENDFQARNVIKNTEGALGIFDDISRLKIVFLGKAVVYDWNVRMDFHQIFVVAACDNSLVHL